MTKNLKPSEIETIVAAYVSEGAACLQFFVLVCFFFLSSFFLSKTTRCL